MQLETFPSDENIAKIVKDYVGDVQIPDTAVMEEESDDYGGGGGPDGRGGGGGGGRGGRDGGGGGGRGGGGGAHGGNRDNDGGGTGRSRGGEDADGRGGATGAASGRSEGEIGGRGGAGGVSSVDPRLPRSKSITLAVEVERVEKDACSGVARLQGYDNQPWKDMPHKFQAITPSLDDLRPSYHEQMQQQQQQQQHRQNPTFRPITIAALPVSSGPTVISTTASLTAQPFIPPENEAGFQNHVQGMDNPRARGATVVTNPNTINIITATPVTSTAAVTGTVGVPSAISSASLLTSVIRRPEEAYTSSSQLDITTDTTLGTTATTTNTATSSETGYDYYDDEDGEGEGENWMDGDRPNLAFVENVIHDFFLPQDGEEDIDGGGAYMIVGDDRRIHAFQPVPAFEEAGDAAIDFAILDGAEDMEDTIVEGLESMSLGTRPATPSTVVHSAGHLAQPALSPCNLVAIAPESQSSATLTITSDEAPISDEPSRASLKDDSLKTSRNRKTNISAAYLKSAPTSQKHMPPVLVSTLTIAEHTNFSEKKLLSNLGNSGIESTNPSGSKTVVFCDSELEHQKKRTSCHMEQKQAIDGSGKASTPTDTSEETNENETVFNVCENATVSRSGFLSTEDLFKDLKLSRIFFSLRDSVMESSVDESRDGADVDSLLEFPILDGNSWDPGSVERYMNVRSTRGSSVDVDGLAVTRASSSTSFDFNRNKNMASHNACIADGTSREKGGVAGCPSSVRTEHSVHKEVSMNQHAKETSLFANNVKKNICKCVSNSKSYKLKIHCLEENRDVLYFREINSLCNSSLSYESLANSTYDSSELENVYLSPAQSSPSQKLKECKRLPSQDFSQNKNGEEKDKDQRSNKKGKEQPASDGNNKPWPTTDDLNSRMSLTFEEIDELTSNCSPSAYIDDTGDCDDVPNSDEQPQDPKPNVRKDGGRRKKGSSAPDAAQAGRTVDAGLTSGTADAGRSSAAGQSLIPVDSSSYASLANPLMGAPSPSPARRTSSVGHSLNSDSAGASVCHRSLRDAILKLLELKHRKVAKDRSLKLSQIFYELEGSNQAGSAGTSGSSTPISVIQFLQQTSLQSGEDSMENLYNAGSNEVLDGESNLRKGENNGHADPGQARNHKDDRQPNKQEVTRESTDTETEGRRRNNSNEIHHKNTNGNSVCPDLISKSLFSSATTTNAAPNIFVRDQRNISEVWGISGNLLNSPLRKTGYPSGQKVFKRKTPPTYSHNDRPRIALPQTQDMCGYLTKRRIIQHRSEKACTDLESRGSVFKAALTDPAMARQPNICARNRIQRQVSVFKSGSKNPPPVSNVKPRTGNRNKFTNGKHSSENGRAINAEYNERSVPEIFEIMRRKKKANSTGALNVCGSKNITKIDKTYAATEKPTDCEEKKHSTPRRLFDGDGVNGARLAWGVSGSKLEQIRVEGAEKGSGGGIWSHIGSSGGGSSAGGGGTDGGGGGLSTGLKEAGGGLVNEASDESSSDDLGGIGGTGGGGGGGAGGGGGGAGSRGGGIGNEGSWSNRKKKPDLKPMFHASLNILHDTVTMSPDVYDVTATAFNMIHDMEDVS